MSYLHPRVWCDFFFFKSNAVIFVADVTECTTNLMRGWPIFKRAFVVFFRQQGFFFFFAFNGCYCGPVPFIFCNWCSGQVLDSWSNFGKLTTPLKAHHCSQFSPFSHYLMEFQCLCFLNFLQLWHDDFYSSSWSILHVIRQVLFKQMKPEFSYFSLYLLGQSLSGLKCDECG